MTTLPAPPPVAEGAEAVLLDFDGPVCSVFAGCPAPDIAWRLLQLVTEAGVRFPRGSGDLTDPLAVLRAAHDRAPHLVPLLDDTLTQAEIHAVRSARSTPGSQEFLVDCGLTGRPVVVVSNNSAEAVLSYLREQELAALVDRVIGRPRHRPELMKPHPSMVRSALAHLGVPPERAVLIGDSVTDILVARRCGVPSIGFANRPEKQAGLLRAGADQVIDCMTRLSRAPA
jgi:beta-phosphoglucomutase-like phosphatase (HAD superfamily)